VGLLQSLLRYLTCHDAFLSFSAMNRSTGGLLHAGRQMHFIGLFIYPISYILPVWRFSAAFATPLCYFSFLFAAIGGPWRQASSRATTAWPRCPAKRDWALARQVFQQYSCDCTHTAHTSAYMRARASWCWCERTAALPVNLRLGHQRVSAHTHIHINAH
jgi:hypothetical protein